MFAGKTGDSPGRDGTIGRVGGRRVETGETEDGSENVVDYFRVSTTLLLTGPPSDTTILRESGEKEASDQCQSVSMYLSSFLSSACGA